MTQSRATSSQKDIQGQNHFKTGKSVQIWATNPANYSSVGLCHHNCLFRRYARMISKYQSLYSQDYEEEEGGLLRLELLETDKRNLGSVSRHWRRSQVSCGWWRRGHVTRCSPLIGPQHHRRPDLRDLRRRPRTRRLRSSSSSSTSSSSQPPPGDVVFLRSYRDGPVDLRTEALMRGMG